MNKLIQDDRQVESIWHRKFPRIGLALVALNVLLYFYGPYLFCSAGVFWLDRGVPEAARCLFQVPLWINADDPSSKLAATYMKARLPRDRTSQEITKANIEAVNLMDKDPQAAKIKFCQLIQQQPRFEWPYGNLARLLYEEGDFAGAERLCRRALDINPDYATANKVLAQIELRAGNLNGAAVHIKRIYDLKLYDEEAVMIGNLINKKWKANAMTPLQ